MSESAPAAPAPAPESALKPAASDLLQPSPAMTVEQAQIKKAELFGTAGFAERVLAGDSEAVRVWRDVTHALRPQVDESTAAGKRYAKNMDSLAILKAKADLPDVMWDHVAASGPVSAEEKISASQAKQRLFADRGWIQKYLDGDRLANSEMTRINMVLASRIGTFQEIENFKAAQAKRLNGK